MKKIRDSLKQQIRDVRKESLEPFITHKDARLRQAEEEVIDNPKTINKIKQ